MSHLSESESIRAAKVVLFRCAFAFLVVFATLNCSESSRLPTADIKSPSEEEFRVDFLSLPKKSVADLSVEERIRFMALEREKPSFRLRADLGLVDFFADSEEEGFSPSCSFLVKRFEDRDGSTFYFTHCRRPLSIQSVPSKDDTVVLRRIGNTRRWEDISKSHLGPGYQNLCYFWDDEARVIVACPYLYNSEYGWTYDKSELSPVVFQ